MFVFPSYSGHFQINEFCSALLFLLNYFLIYFHFFKKSRGGGQSPLAPPSRPSKGFWRQATFRPHERVSSPLEPCPSNIWDMRRVLYFEKLLFLGIRGLHSLMLTFKLTQANYFPIATKCRADGTKKSSRRPVLPVKSAVSKEEERNYQWKREKNTSKQCPSRIEKPVQRGKNRQTWARLLTPTVWKCRLEEDNTDSTTKYR